MRRPGERAERAAFAVVFAAVAGVVGYGVHAITVPTPPACQEMADLGIETYQLWADVATATRVRGDALDPETYAVHDAEVNHLMASLKAIAPKYDDAAADCVGAP